MIPPPTQRITHTAIGHHPAGCSACFGAASGSAAAGLGVAALMGAAYSRRIAAEEDMLTGTLGTAYAEYSQRTNRLIPFIW